MKLCVQNPESAKNSKNSMLPASYRDTQQKIKIYIKNKYHTTIPMNRKCAGENRLNTPQLHFYYYLYLINYNTPQLY